MVFWLARSTGKTPAAAQPTLAALLDGSHNSDLVQIEARLVDWAITGQNVTLILQSGNQLFKALLNHAGSGRPPLPERNAFAHIWLGLKLVFGESWRERADPESVHAFLNWIEREPNPDYGEYAGPVRERIDEPGLFDGT